MKRFVIGLILIVLGTIIHLHAFAGGAALVVINSSNEHERAVRNQTRTLKEQYPQHPRFDEGVIRHPFDSKDYIADFPHPVLTGALMAVFNFHGKELSQMESINIYPGKTRIALFNYDLPFSVECVYQPHRTTAVEYGKIIQSYRQRQVSFSQYLPSQIVTCTKR